MLIVKYLLPSHIFSGSVCVKGTMKAPAVDFLRLNTLRATKTTFVTPKRYGEWEVHWAPELYLWFWKASEL